MKRYSGRVIGPAKLHNVITRIAARVSFGLVRVNAYGRIRLCCYLVAIVTRFQSQTFSLDKGRFRGEYSRWMVFYEFLKNSTAWPIFLQMHVFFRTVNPDEINFPFSFFFSIGRRAACKKQLSWSDWLKKYLYGVNWLHRCATCIYNTDKSLRGPIKNFNRNARSVSMEKVNVVDRWVIVKGVQWIFKRII